MHRDYIWHRTSYVISYKISNTTEFTISEFYHFNSDKDRKKFKQIFKRYRNVPYIAEKQEIK